MLKANLKRYVLRFLLKTLSVGMLRIAKGSHTEGVLIVGNLSNLAVGRRRR